jgi:hypothetical protein
MQTKSELLTLLNGRKAWAADSLDGVSLPLKRGDHTPKNAGRLIAEHAKVHRSDPFAAARFKLYLSQGYITC